MIFRATQKLSSRLRVAYATTIESRSTMVEWYCNLITVRRRQFFLFTHAPSLFSFWVPAAGTTRNDFGRVFRRHATDTLRDYGFSNIEAATVMDDGPDAFAKATDRSIVGSMVDYVKMLRHAVDDEGGLEHLGPRAMNDIANESPMSRIGMADAASYLRHVLRSERPHNIAVHRTGARGPQAAGFACVLEAPSVNLGARGRLTAMAKKAKSGSKKKRATKNLNVSASAAKRVKGGTIKYIK